MTVKTREKRPVRSTRELTPGDRVRILGRVASRPEPFRARTGTVLPDPARPGTVVVNLDPLPGQAGPARYPFHLDELRRSRG